jgi:hypothetical protein
LLLIFLGSPFVITPVLGAVPVGDAPAKLSKIDNCYVVGKIGTLRVEQFDLKQKLDLEIVDEQGNIIQTDIQQCMIDII